MLTPEKIQKLKTLLPYMTPQEKRETLADLARWEHEITLKMGQRQSTCLCRSRISWLQSRSPPQKTCKNI
jgi:hypothetical protein